MEQVVIDAIRAHAAQEYPKESCGLVIVVRGKSRYKPCRNIAGTPGQHFFLSPEDYADAADEGTITHVVHSHPNASVKPSQADLIGCEASGLPWVIVNWPNGNIGEFAPSGYVLPLIGRKYMHGVTDCFSLVRDYFQQKLDITLPDFPRDDEWWLKGGNLYMENFASCDAVEVRDGTMQENDVLFMQVASPVINHAAVYIGDNLIIQHCRDRLSSRDIFGGYWRKVTVKVIRHRRFINA